MPEIGYLKDLVIVLASATVVVAILRRVGVPVIAGFILAGTLVGPMGLRLVDDTHQVEVLSEIGVVLLLFGIGLEISLERFRRLWKAVLLGGGIQVGFTIVCTALLASGFGLTPRDAVFLGCVIAVSSTAIVLRGLSARGELEAPHCRLAVGILVFQDLCVVPMDSGSALSGGPRWLDPGDCDHDCHRRRHPHGSAGRCQAFGPALTRLCSSDEGARVVHSDRLSGVFWNGVDLIAGGNPACARGFSGGHGGRRKRIPSPGNVRSYSGPRGPFQFFLSFPWVCCWMFPMCSRI